MKIPFCQPLVRRSYASAVRSQVLSGWMGPGLVTEKYSQEIRKYVSAPYCVCTTSGTIALSVAAIALGLKPGDEILVPSYGVISTINAFASIGLRPRLVEIDRDTGCMSPRALSANIRPSTRAVCFVDFSGYAGPSLQQSVAICAKRGIPLIEDAACAFGNYFKGVAAGTFGTIGTYSFSVPKIITTGQGGCLVTRSRACYQKVLRYIDHGDVNWRKTNKVRTVGTNLRYNDILAAAGLAQLKDMSSRLARKKCIYGVLCEELGENIYRLPEDVPPLFYIVFARERSRLVRYLRSRGIDAVCQYRTICEHPAYLSLRKDVYPNSDFWTRHAVYLPFGLSLQRNDMFQIARAVLNSGVELLNVR